MTPIPTSCFVEASNEWFKWSNFCHPCRKSELSSRTPALTQPSPVPAVVDIGEVNHRACCLVPSTLPSPVKQHVRNKCCIWWYVVGLQIARESHQTRSHAMVSFLDHECRLVLDEAPGRRRPCQLKRVPQGAVESAPEMQS